MNHPQAPKKQTQNKANSNPFKANPELAEALSAAEGAVEWANFFKGQNRLPKNLATPARQFHNRIRQYYKIRVKHYFLAGLWMQTD